MPRPLRHSPPYSFQYRFIVNLEFFGERLIDFFLKRFSFKPEGYWLDLIERGETTVNNTPVAPDYVLQKGDVIRTWRRDVEEPPVNDEIEIIYDQKGVFALNKKAPIPVHPSGRYYKNSLTEILAEKYPTQKFHTIHRLDLWTTGVLLLATEETRAEFLHLQVKKQQIKKTYGVLAVGEFGMEPFTISEPIGRVQGCHRSYGVHVPKAKDAVTVFTPLIKNNGVTFLKAEPLTGRTNQIRVHVQAAGGHVLNDPLYSPNPTKDLIPFLGLHCRSLTFLMQQNSPLTLTAEWPEGYREYFSLARKNGFYGWGLNPGDGF